MNCPDVISLLNRLCHLMLRSFPAYSVAVRPVTYRGSEETYDLLRRIADEQQTLAEQMTEAVRERKAAPDPGMFPIDFTGWNDVALPRIVDRSHDLLLNVVSEAEAIADGNPDAPVFHFAKEVVNLTKRHLELLEGASAVNGGIAK